MSLLASLRTNASSLASTARTELGKSEVVDLLGIGMGSAWFLLGFSTWRGLKKEDYMNSTYARRYYSKYRKLAAQEQAAAHAAHPH